MRIIVGVLILAALAAGFLIFSDSGRETSLDDIVPNNALPEERRAEIRRELLDIQNSARDVVRKFGKDATPLIIERVEETYRKGSDWEYQDLYAQAENLIISLGEMGDERAEKALEMWVSEEKYRVFRDEAARALGKLGDKSAIDSLWKAWEEEKGYLLEGDDQGPWPFSGYHPSGGYVHSMLEDIAKSLHQLGENEVIAELIEVGKLSEGRWEAGYTSIVNALSDISGQDMRPEMLEMDYWEDWWAKNKSRYLPDEENRERR